MTSVSKEEENVVWLLQVWPTNIQQCSQTFLFTCEAKGKAKLKELQEASFKLNMQLAFFLTPRKVQ